MDGERIEDIRLEDFVERDGAIVDECVALRARIGWVSELCEIEPTLSAFRLIIRAQIYNADGMILAEKIKNPAFEKVLADIDEMIIVNVSEMLGKSVYRLLVPYGTEPGEAFSCCVFGLLALSEIRGELQQDYPMFYESIRKELQAKLRESMVASMAAEQFFLNENELVPHFNPDEWGFE